MSRLNIKKYYSTKRKPDLVTGSAIFFFAALILFQLYITIIFPFQLRHQDLLIAEMERDEMFDQIDRIRELIRSTKGRNSAETGEIKLVTGVMDQFALHVRENGKNMTPEQVGKLRIVLTRYENIVRAWQKEEKVSPEQVRAIRNDLSDYDPKITTEKPEPKFHIIQDELDTAPYAATIEAEILNSRY